jgi:hypothetical protein
MGVAAAIAGAAVVGAGASIISGNKAAGAAQYAADKSEQTQRYMYDTTRADYAPYRSVGYNALGKLAGLYGVGTKDPYAAQPTGMGGFGQYGGVGVMGAAQPAAQGTTNGTPDYGGFYASPSYQFRLAEGMKAIERSAASRGSLRGGATQKAINNYAQGEASTEFDNYANRLASLAGVGQSATGSTAQAGQNYANGTSNAYTDAGNARASAYQNTGNAINGGLTNIASAYLYNKGYGGGGGGGGGAFYDPSYTYGGG